MKTSKLNQRFGRLISLFVALVVATSPLQAQQKHNAPKTLAAEVTTPAPTFDTLLAADSYKIYCEVRGVGGLIRSAAVSDLLEPVIKLGGPPKEFKELVTWLNAHSDTLAGSRMMVAGWASRPNLPNVIVAIEFSSPAEAKKFFPELRNFLPTLFPTPTPTPSPTPAELPKPISKETTVPATGTTVAPMATPQQTAAVAEKETAPPAPPYQMKQLGSLVLVSDTAFSLRNLNPRGSKSLEEDQNFLLARNRFASESVFLYIDVNAIEKEDQERRKKYEEEEQKRIEEETRNPPKPEESPEMEEPVIPSAEEQAVPTPAAETTIESEQPAELVATVPPGSTEATVAEPSPSEPDAFTPLLYGIYGAFFGGESKWPEAIGAGLVFEGDAYVVRTLIINGAETKNNAIPFVPQFFSGPAITPESPNIFPADTDLFVSVSLDYPQIYEGLVKAMARAQEQMIKMSRVPIPDGTARETPFAAYEKRLGLKIKDDLLPLLGNELALAIPRKPLATVAEVPARPQPADEKSGSGNPPVPVQNPNPIIAIAIKDREAVGKLIPKIIEGFGLKGASMLAQTEKRDGTEIVSYAGVFSYAFLSDFLVISPDPAETRRVVDAYLNHQTLASDSHFRNSTHWQPRQVLGQVYLSPRVVEQYLTGGGSYGPASEQTSEFLSRINPTIDPLTYALTNDGLGPLHELHVPKNLLMLQVVTLSAKANESLPASNESVAKSVMRSVGSAEATFKATENSYGTLDQLVSAGFLGKEMADKYGYRIEIAASKDKFEITAVPLEYGQTGKLSFFLDESQVLRGGDHGGGAATVADQPLEQ